MLVVALYLMRLGARAHEMKMGVSEKRVCCVLNVSRLGGKWVVRDLIVCRVLLLCIVPKCIGVLL